MRCFIAVEIPETIQEKLKTIQKEFKDENSNIKFTNSFHLTLKFLGDISEEDAEKVRALISNVKFKKFLTNISGMGYFGKPNFIKVIWAGIIPDLDIINLQNQIDSSLKEIFKEEKSFKPHLTLGRVKFVKDKEKFLSCIEKIKFKDILLEINEFWLIESKLTPEGAIYKPLFKVILE